MFVIMQSLDNLKAHERQEGNIPQNVGETMKARGPCPAYTSGSCHVGHVGHVGHSGHSGHSGHVGYSGHSCVSWKMNTKHAGVAITVTSITDIVVFAVGSSTVSNAF